MKRDVEHERHLVTVAALSVGLASGDGVGGYDVLPVVESLNQWAERRAWPGDVVLPPERETPLDVEAAEELADLRSYLVWWVQSNLDGALAGDAEASCEYERGMRALAGTLVVWAALHGSG